MVKTYGFLASEQLEPGSIYTRKDLAALFNIKDATLNNGIFRPKGYNSVWLFITENKTSDRTQYADKLKDDVLHMQGQRLGRTDALILEHRQRDLELLLFYRKEKYEHQYAGFLYEGVFRYESHSGSAPTSFVLTRSPTEKQGNISVKIEQRLNFQDEFNPKNLSDARVRTMVSIVRRRGQSDFRKKLLKAYEGRCAMTRCSLEAVLEAAHIHPYLGDKTNVTSNGLILRSDLHTLFDLGLIWVNPVDLHIEISEELRASEYGLLEGKPLHLPAQESDHPSRLALYHRHNNINQRNSRNKNKTKF